MSPELIAAYENEWLLAAQARAAGANVGALKPMPIGDDLRALLGPDR